MSNITTNSRASNRPKKRDRTQAVMSAVLDDDLTFIEDGTYQSTNEFNDMAMKKLQREQAREIRKPGAIPYHMWSETARKGHEDFISRIATQVERRAITPNDPNVREKFRRMEAAHASEQGVASISIYDASRPDPEYAKKPLGVGDHAPRRIGGAIDHNHLKEETRIVEMRYANGLDTRRPISSETIATERFSEACIPVDCQSALHSLDTFDQANRFAAKMKSRDRTKSGPNDKLESLESFIKTIRLECAMPIFCVRFLYDNTIELCMHMEANASYFAVFTFSIDEHVRYEARRNGADEDRELQIIKNRICAEVSKERKKSEERLRTVENLLQAPIHSLTTEQVSERTKMLEDEREFRALADKFHVRFEESPEAAEEDRLIARFCSLGVFAFVKSPLLLSLPCKFLYHYFSTCQCLMDVPEVAPPVSSATADASTSAENRLFKHKKAEVRPKSETDVIDGNTITASIGFDFNKNFKRR